MSLVTTEPQSLPPSLEQKAVPSPGQGEILRTEAVSTGLNWREILRPEIPQNPQNVRQMAEAMRQAQQEQSIEVSPQALTTGRYLMQEMGLMIGNICKDNNNNNIINIQTDSLFGLAEQLQKAFNLYGIKVDFTKPELVQQAVDQLFEKNPKLALSIAVAYSEKKLEIISKAYQITRGEKIEEEKKDEQEKKEQGIPDEAKDKLKQLRTYTRKVKINLNTGEVSVVDIDLSDEELAAELKSKGVKKPYRFTLNPFRLFGILNRDYKPKEVRQMLQQLGANIGEVGEFYLEFSEGKDQQGEVIQIDSLDENEKTFLQQLGLIEGNNRFTLTPQTDPQAIEKQNQFIANLASQITEITSLRGEFFRLTGLPQSEISKYLLDVAIQDPKIKAVLERIGGTPLTDLLTKIKDQQSQEAKRQLQERKTELTIQRLKARKKELEKKLEKAKEREGRESGGEDKKEEDISTSSGLLEALKKQLRGIRKLPEGIDLKNDSSLINFEETLEVLETEKIKLSRKVKRLEELEEQINSLYGELSKVDFSSREITHTDGRIEVVSQKPEDHPVNRRIQRLQKQYDSLLGDKKLEDLQEELDELSSQYSKNEDFLKKTITINGQTRTVQEWIEEYRRLKFQETTEKGSGEGQSNEERRSVKEIQRDLNAVEVLLGYYSVEAQNARGERIASYSGGIEVPFDWELVNPKVKELLVKFSIEIGLDVIDKDTYELTNPNNDDFKNMYRQIYILFGPDFVQGVLGDSVIRELSGSITVQDVLDFLDLSVDPYYLALQNDYLENLFDNFIKRINNGRNFDDLFRQPASKQSQP